MPDTSNGIEAPGFPATVPVYVGTGGVQVPYAGSPIWGIPGTDAEDGAPTSNQHFRDVFLSNPVTGQPFGFARATVNQDRYYGQFSSYTNTYPDAYLRAYYRPKLKTLFRR